MYIPDPVELIESRIDRLIGRFVDEYTCMECGQKKNYELMTASVRPDSPLVCNECLGR